MRVFKLDNINNVEQKDFYSEKLREEEKSASEWLEDAVSVKKERKKSYKKEYRHDEHGIHIVSENENLWIISRNELGKGSRYREIIALNQLKSAEDIRPGQILKLPRK